MYRRGELQSLEEATAILNKLRKDSSWYSPNCCILAVKPILRLGDESIETKLSLEPYLLQ